MIPKPRKIRSYYTADGVPLYLGDEVYYIYFQAYDGSEHLYKGIISKIGRDYVVYVDEGNWFYLKHCRGECCSLISHPFERNEPDIHLRIEYQKKIIERLNEFAKPFTGYDLVRIIQPDIKDAEDVLKSLYKGIRGSIPDAFSDDFVIMFDKKLSKFIDSQVELDSDFAKILDEYSKTGKRKKTLW